LSKQMITKTHALKAARPTGMTCWFDGRFASSVSPAKGLESLLYQPLNLQARIDNTKGGFLM